MSDELAYPPPPSGPPSPDPVPEGNQTVPPPPAEPTPPASEPAPAVHPAPPPPGYPAAAAPPSAPYPAQPTQPPPGAYPTPLYPAAAYGYAPAPASHGPSRRAWLAITAGTAALLLVLGAVGYGVGGYLFASNRISGAAGAINSASSHRVSINTAFEVMAQQITSLDSADGKTNKATSGQIVSDSQTLASTLAADTQALRSAQVRLDDLSWLTTFSRGGLKDEADRVAHARKALADVKSAADDSGHLGQFLQAFFQVQIDLDTLLTDLGNGDVPGSTSAFSSLRSDTPNALQLVGVPGLPTQFHDFLTAIQAYGADVRQVLLARAGGDQNAIAAAEKMAVADFNKAVAVDFAGATATLRAYYQHYRDDFNAEMDMATT